MKKQIALILTALLIATLFCGCVSQSNPLRATLTYSASNGATGVIVAFEKYDTSSAIYRATQEPLVITFNSRYTPEPVLDYEFYCPACNKKEVGKLFPPQSYICVCNCDDGENEPGIQAIVIKACYSEEALAETMPQYEAAESYTYFNETEPEFSYEAEKSYTESTTEITATDNSETESTENTEETVPPTIGY